jgi:hypothetical protein
VAPVQGAPAQQSTCTSWNLATDFQISPNQANPNPDSCGNPAVWYFYGGNPNYTHVLLQTFTSDFLSINGLEAWMGPHFSQPNDLLPVIGTNATGVVQHPSTITWPADVILVHPYATGGLTVGWQSPVTGIVSVTGGVTDLDANCGNGINWFIAHGTTTLASGGYPNGGKQPFANGQGGSSLASVSVTAGDFLYVVVGPGKNNDFGCDSTELDLTITSVG